MTTSTFWVIIYYMSKQYTTNKDIMFFIKYHLVFCPRYRRKIFLIEGLEDRFKELTEISCNEQGIDVISIVCYPDFVQIIVQAPPYLSIPFIVRSIKMASSHVLRDEFSVLSAMPSLWTRGYFVSTEDTVTPECIASYVSQLKTRP